MADDKENGWPEYQRLVISQLHDCRNRLGRIEKRLGGIEVDLGQQKVRTTLFGSLAGAVSAAIMWVITRG
jgi:hypothetical protein